ncbi:hypothetical protein RvY_15998 [Ramazzottius varieornatus]|uniref:Uncharacterized protein n=1 Tax=Ramazzottius varieornatus TaxID=947166 RepID=A0A1D1VWW3_RAMVA|nr:hypothetical protein RvY_15998 [Ramazzottius varieornatus]
MFIIVLSAAFVVVRLIDYYWAWLNYIGLDPRPEKVPTRPPLLARWHKIYLWGLAVIQIANFLLICTFNALLLYVIAKQNNTRSTTLLATRHDGKLEAKLDRGAVALLLSCVMLYLITQSPGFIYNPNVPECSPEAPDGELDFQPAEDVPPFYNVRKPDHQTIQIHHSTTAVSEHRLYPVRCSPCRQKTHD